MTEPARDRRIIRDPQPADAAGEATHSNASGRHASPDPLPKDDMADDDDLLDAAPDLEEELDEDLDDTIDEELDDDLDEEEFVAGDAEVDDLVEDVEVDEGSTTEARPERRPAGGDDDDEEEDFDADDVEEDLDTILRDRIAAGTDEEDDEDDVALDTEDRTNSANRVQPKRPEEFVCQSCFLVKHPSQLADAKNQLCADCV